MAKWLLNEGWQLNAGIVKLDTRVSGSGILLIFDDLMYIYIENTCVVILKNSNYDNMKKTETKESKM